MGVKLMTGATGEQNIQAADDRECLAGITGLDSYVFPTGNKLKATLVDANTVTIGTGAGSLQGSRFRCSTTTTVNIQSGTQGQFRHDIIGLHFSRETSGREGLEFQVLTGEPAASEGAAADPAYTAGDLLKGDAEAFMPLYRVKLSGINASDPEPLFSVLTPLATLGDSVSQSEWAYLYGGPGVGKSFVRYRRDGARCVLQWGATQGTSAYWAAGNLPEQMRPADGSVYVPGVCVSPDGMVENICAYCYVSALTGEVGLQVATTTNRNVRNYGETSWFI